MERAKIAEGVTWIQWRKVARKEHKRETAEKKERLDEGGEEIRISGPNRRRSGCRHPGEGKCG